MKATELTTELLMYATNKVRTLKFYRIDGLDVYDKCFVVECTPSKSYTTIGNFEARFANYDDAEKCFKMFVKEYLFEKVFISDEHLDWMNAEITEAPPTQEEEYAEACMASACGDESLMMRYERKYGIEKEYSPSNPWDAPGMSIRDFI